VPMSKIIDKAIEVNATAIGLSALLVSTSKQMPLIVKELHHKGLHIPVMIGGAAINRPYAHRTLFVAESIPYEAGVFYAKDAFEGLALMDRIIQPEDRQQLVLDTISQARRAMEAPSRQSFQAPVESLATDGKTVRQVDPPTPPFVGAREMNSFGLADIWDHMDLKTMYRLHWGGKGLKDAAWEDMLHNEFEPRLRKMTREAEETGWLAPRVRYGFFPANSDGNDLIVFSPDDPDREIARFPFPRQPARERLCLADYFLPLSAGKRDVVAFQIVTVGKSASERTDRLQAEGEYSESFFSHGLGVSAAEGVAEYVHQRIRDDLGIGPEGGKRYSWGYPACPDLSQHKLVEELLDSQSIGINITEGFQFDPEQTTAAIIVPHPDAKYYAMARTGGMD